jgi:hypothetical protein
MPGTMALWTRAAVLAMVVCVVSGGIRPTWTPGSGQLPGTSVRLWNGSYVTVVDPRVCSGHHDIKSMSEMVGKISDPRPRITTEANATYWRLCRAKKIDGWMGELTCKISWLAKPVQRTVLYLHAAP